MIDTAIKVAREAGRILMENFARDKEVSTKGDGTLVTNADIESDKRIIEIIKQDYPEHNILSEESTMEQTASVYRWIIDPLDGTSNYVYGLPFFGVSVALEKNKNIILGVIYLPYFDMLFHAEKGKGAYINDKKICVSSKKFDLAMMSYESELCFDSARRIKLLSLLASHVSGVRLIGATSVALTFLAMGKLDLYISFADAPWDIAAGALIVEEAGGKVTNFQNQKWGIDDRNFVVSNNRFHGDVIKIIKDAEII